MKHQTAIGSSLDLSLYFRFRCSWRSNIQLWLA